MLNFRKKSECNIWKTMKNKFCAFIMTHGRADKVITYNVLRKCGYTGPIFIVIDDEDDQEQRYRDIYGDQVVQFSKKAMDVDIDLADNEVGRGTITYVRNACFDLAKKLGFDYFIELDDDYSAFLYKHDGEYKYKETRIKNLDKVFGFLIKYLDRSGAQSIAFAQNGDFIGGKNSGFAKDWRPRRKCMNSFVCRTDRKFKFMGRMNEDVNTYTKMGSIGMLFMTIPNISLIQGQTQATSGGLTEMYLKMGTYKKSFTTVMFCPSSVKVSEMGDKHRRIHHKIKWNYAVPKIVSEEFKKR
jgi:hypothetical protein